VLRLNNYLLAEGIAVLDSPAGSLAQRGTTASKNGPARVSVLLDTAAMMFPGSAPPAVFALKLA
jgi:hypothetical protein